MHGTNVLFEVSNDDKDEIIAALSETGVQLLDEIEVKRLDGIDTIQLLVDISKIAIPGGVGLILGILQNRRVTIKKQGVEYRGPFDKEIIEQILGKDES